MRMWRRAVLAAFLLMTAVPAQVAAQGQVSFERARLEVATASGRRHAFEVEVAQSARQMAQGLMFRRVLAKDAGMLFDFGRPQPVSMWMKNTLIPLDMLFIDAEGRVIGIAERTIPMSTAVISAPSPARAVLEVNAGTAAQLGIAAGDRIVHPIFGAR